jgi:hypothetical protein
MAVHIMEIFYSILGPIIGTCIIAALVLLLATPLLIGLLMALKILRYREWLAILAVGMSMAILVESADYIYNLIYMTSSRMSLAMNITMSVLSFGTPPFLFVLVLARSRRRWVWGLGILILTSLSLLSMRNEFRTRVERDAEAYRQGIKPLTPQTGTGFVRWWRHYRGTKEMILLQGHIPEATRIVLLTDPFTSRFQPQFCMGAASTYWPPVKDPAELGNVTEVAGAKDCHQDWVSGVAALDRSVSIYRAVPFQPFSGGFDQKLFAYPVVRRAFQEFHYDPANFDTSKAELTQAMGLRQTVLFSTALQPIRTPPNAFPCSDPAVLISTHDLGNVKLVLPYCALNWNLFQLDDELYFTATTQPPTPPGYEIMNPDQTSWLWRVEGTELKQLWPPL